VHIAQLAAAPEVRTVVVPGFTGRTDESACLCSIIYEAEGGQGLRPQFSSSEDYYATEIDERSSITSDVGLIPISDNVRLATASAAASKYASAAWMYLEVTD
jgi:hypothetical protein